MVGLDAAMQHPLAPAALSFVIGSGTRVRHRGHRWQLGLILWTVTVRRTRPASHCCSQGISEVWSGCTVLETPFECSTAWHVTMLRVERPHVLKTLERSCSILRNQAKDSVACHHWLDGVLSSRGMRPVRRKSVGLREATGPLPDPPPTGPQLLTLGCNTTTCCRGADRPHCG